MAMALTLFLSCVVASSVSCCPDLLNEIPEFTLDFDCYLALSHDHWMATRACYYQQPSPAWVLWHCTLVGKIAAPAMLWSTSALGLSTLVEQPQCCCSLTCSSAVSKLHLQWEDNLSHPLLSIKCYILCTAKCIPGASGSVLLLGVYWLSLFTDFPLKE